MVNNSYYYRLAEIKDLEEITKIHIQEFSGYFLTSFGENLIYKFYESYLKSNEIFVIAESKKEIKGFILGSNGSIARKIFFKENFSKTTFIILKEMLKGNKVLWNGIWKRFFL